MDNHITEVLNVTPGVTWLPWAVSYIFLIGLSYGSFILTLPYFVFGKAAYEKLGRLALLAALACGLTAPITLTADLHGPGRSLNFYLYFQPQSWMSWGSLFIPAYLFSLLFYAWLALRGDFALLGKDGASASARLYRLLGREGGTPQGLIIAAALLAFAGAVLMALYTGMEIMTVAVRPLWNTPFLPFVFAATGLSGAVGLSLLFNRFIGDRDNQLETGLNRLLLPVLAIVLMLVGAWLVTGISSSAAWFNRIAETSQWRLAAVVIVLLILLPMALAIKRPASSGLINGLIAVSSAWLIRWFIIIGGQSIPKTDAGLYHYHLPLGSDGLLGIFGALGLWIALLLLMLEYVPWAGQAFVNRSQKESDVLAASAITRN